MRTGGHAYAYTHAIPAFPEYSNSETETLATAIGASAAQFVVAHEYAHALLGHVDSAPLGTLLFTGGGGPEREVYLCESALNAASALRQAQLGVPPPSKARFGLHHPSFFHS